MRDLALLPKAHLHLHFTGSMRAATLTQLAAEHHLRLPGALTGAAPLALSADQRGWFRFQRLYDAARACVTGEDELRRLVLEAAQDDAAEGSRRLEIQIEPSTYATRVGGITPVVEIVLDAARQARAATGVSVGIILAASRMRHPLDARTIARLAARHAGEDGVVGFGLSNDELRGDTRDFAPAFRIARDAGLLSVPHGGELLGAEHVRDVFEALHPDRIGHGVRAVEDERVLDMLVAADVTFEVCPMSNVRLGVYESPEQVPLRRLQAAGARISLSADDPVIFGSRLTDQYLVARERLGLSDQELAAIAADSIRASAAPDADKRDWLADVAAWLASPDGDARRTRLGEAGTDRLS